MSLKRSHLIITLLISLVVFSLVTFVFTASNGYGYDLTVMQWIDQLSSTLLTQVMTFISLLGSSEVILLATGVIALIFIIRGNWFMTLFFLTVSVGGVVLNLLLKLLFQRERPGGEVKHIEVFNFSLDIPSYSFPSGHTMRITILLLFLMYLSYRFFKKSSIRFVSYVIYSLLMIGVALSRLFLEAHFLSDTIGAMSISLAWFTLCLLFFQRYEIRRTRSRY